MNDKVVRIGCVGAGTLGAAIMRRLLECGHEVRVWNRTREKLAPLEALGAIVTDSPAALTEASDFIITCVTDGAAMEAAVFGENGVAAGAHAGALLIDMSTIDAGLTQSLAERLRAEHAMGWLDAPISGGAPAALGGRMAVMVGGTSEDFERARPVWDALAARATLMGGQGAGQSTKMINQVFVSCGFAVLAEACALAERAGVDPSRIPAALAGGRADSRLMQEFLGKMAGSDFERVEGRLDIMLKDLGMIGDLARRVGAVMPVTSMVEQLHRKVMADGLGAADNTQLVDLYRDRRSS